MKRAEKIALLNKILTGQADETTRQQLQGSTGWGMVLVSYVSGNGRPGPDDIVSFEHKGQQVSMPLKDIKAFVRYDPLTILLSPDGHYLERISPNRR